MADTVADVADVKTLTPDSTPSSPRDSAEPGSPGEASLCQNLDTSITNFVTRTRGDQVAGSRVLAFAPRPRAAGALAPRSTFAPLVACHEAARLRRRVAAARAARRRGKAPDRLARALAWARAKFPPDLR